MIRLLCIVICLFTFFSCSNDAPTDYLLFDFELETELDMIHWKCFTFFSLSTKHVSHGSKSLHMAFYPSNYPGLNPEFKLSDWSDYKAFCFDIFNPDKEEIEIFVRIDDRKKNPGYIDRYNNKFLLKPQWNHICISFDNLKTSGTHRQLNLKNIRKFIIFMASPKRKYELFIDHVRLVS